MATYVISDIHGAYHRLMNVLNQAYFDPAIDSLYVLGDLTDRLPNSGKVLEWAYSAPASIHFLAGNHEDMMLTFFRQQDAELKIYKGSLMLQEEMSEEDFLWQFAYDSLWCGWNGGIGTWEYLMSLPREHREDILKWIETWPLYYDIEVQGRRFVLVHAGFAMNGIRMGDDRYPDGLSKWVNIQDFPEQHSQSLLWIRDGWFFNDSELPCDVVFGHTPTPYLYEKLNDINEWYEIDGEEKIPIEKGKEILHFGRGLKKHCIDTGREVLSLLRLDDMMEFTSDLSETSQGDAAIS